MSNTQTCAVKMFKDLFSKGAESYQLAERHHHQSLQQQCLRQLRAEKLSALRLMDRESSQQHDYPLPAPVRTELNAILQSYDQCLYLRDFIDIEKRLLSSLRLNLTALIPSALSLNLRKIATRHQQCLEKLSVEVSKCDPQVIQGRCPVRL